MRQALNKKINQVNSLKEDIQKSEALILVDYRGMDVSKMQELRKRLKNINTKYKVIKNSLLKKAIDGDGNLGQYLTGPTAIILINKDIQEATKVLFSFIKQFKMPQIKIGLLIKNDKMISPDMIEYISQLPSKEILYCRLMQTMKFPINNFVFLLKSIIQKFVLILIQLKEKKEV
jgi:large subunit ribosomal protein L10